jgi:hypothetical protein
LHNGLTNHEEIDKDQAGAYLSDLGNPVVFHYGYGDVTGMLVEITFRNYDTGDFWTTRGESFR